MGNQTCCSKENNPSNDYVPNQQLEQNPVSDPLSVQPENLGIGSELVH